MMTLGRSRVRAGLWLVRREVSWSLIGWNFGRSSVSLHRSICTMLWSLHNQIIGTKNFLTLPDTFAHPMRLWKNITLGKHYYFTKIITAMIIAQLLPLEKGGSGWLYNSIAYCNASQWQTTQSLWWQRQCRGGIWIYSTIVGSEHQNCQLLDKHGN